MKKTFLSVIFTVSTLFVTFAQVKFHRGSQAGIAEVTNGILNNKIVDQSIKLKVPHFPEKLLPDQYGIPEIVNIKISNKNSSSNWVVEFRAIGSSSIDLIINNLSISEGSILYIYNKEKTSVLGPIDSHNTRDILTTPTFDGETVYIQVIEGSKGLSHFTISQVIYGSSDSGNSNAQILTIGSIDCIPSATCATPWINEANAAGRISIGGFIGSGTLLNNEAEDGRPFFLTAFHVLDINNDDLLSTAEKNGTSSCSIILDERWTTCAGSTLMTAITLTGASFRSAWVSTDFALIEAFDNPFIASVVRYAGWNRSGSTPSSGVFLHHPAGSHMRYSSTYAAAIRIHPLHWNYFQVLDFDIGFTRKGSSGCAFFNGNHQVVGQLFGGLPAVFCADPISDKRFGRFYDSWDGGGTSDTQLKHWLSPTLNLSSMNTFNRLRFTANQNEAVCYGSNRTYTLDNITIAESATWSVTGGISIVSSTFNSITVTATNPGTNGAANITATFGTESVVKTIWYGKPTSVYGTMDGIPVSYPQPCSTASRLAVVGQGIQNCSWTVTDGSIAITPVSGQPHMCDIGYFYDYVRIKAQPSNTCGSGSDYTFYLIDPSMWFMAYPNPATNELTIQFSDISNSELLPKAVYLYHESSTIPKKQANIKEIYDKNGLTEGNKLLWNVSDLPRGVYYLHVVPSEKSGKKEVEKLRIILE